MVERNRKSHNEKKKKKKGGLTQSVRPKDDKLSPQSWNKRISVWLVLLGVCTGSVILWWTTERPM